MSLRLEFFAIDVLQALLLSQPVSMYELKSNEVSPLVVVRQNSSF